MSLCEHGSIAGYLIVRAHCNAPLTPHKSQVGSLCNQRMSSNLKNRHTRAKNNNNNSYSNLTKSPLNHDDDNSILFGRYTRLGLEVL